MKRIFLIGGISIIVILAGILLFLLFASDEQKEGIFNRFNINSTDSGGNIIEEIVDTITGNDDEDFKEALRQLTTKQVVGEMEIDQTASSSATLVYFAEAGTGHVYMIDVIVGNETRLSNITIQGANKAVFSRDGAYALIAKDGGQGGQQMTLITLPKDGQELTSFTLSEPAKDFTFTEDGFILYSTTMGDVLAVRSFDLAKKESATLFSLPFKEAVVRFGAKSTDSMLVYPKTAEKLEGYLYLTRGGKLERLPVSGYGLSALPTTGGVLYSQFSGDTYSTHFYHKETGSTAGLLVSVVAEKCLAAVGDGVLCGSQTAYERGSLENWYKGISFVNDDLWLIDTGTYQVEKLITPKDIAGRDFDITTLNTSRDVSRVYFINKTDNSLWLFDRSLAPVQ
jgi:hypothetical protein